MRKNVTRTGGGKPATPAPKSPPRERIDPGKVTLPTKPTKPITRIEDCTFTIYGERGIGKTSLCAHFPGAFHLMFEAGNKGVEIYERPVLKWEQVPKYVDLILESSFQTVVIDTVDFAYRMCKRAICKRNNWKHPTDPGWGKGWDAVMEEFEGAMGPLMAAKAVVFISHVSVREFQTRLGVVNKIVPSASGQASDFCVGQSEIVGYYGYYGDDRFLSIRGSESLEAKCRLENNFHTTGGKQVHSIPMGDSSREAYAAIVRAFENKQPDTGKPKQRPGLSSVRAKPRSR